jgi:uncharacterized membrane protein YphA (DoxX/SURF4 family)
MKRRQVWAIAREGLLWVVTGLAASTLFDAGLGKFASNAGWVYWFGRWGYPARFVTLIGLAEAGGALLMLLPALASYAAASLIVVMVGAFYTVITNETDLSWFDPVFNVALLLVVLAGRWTRRAWGRAG